LDLTHIYFHSEVVTSLVGMNITTMGLMMKNIKIFQHGKKGS